MKHKTYLLAGSALALAAFTVAGASFAAAPAKSTGGNSTAQSIMVNVSTTSNLTVVNQEVLNFDPTQATAFFQTDISGPLATCTGGKCGDTTQPTTPTAPAALTSEALKTATANQCAFVTALATGVPQEMTGETYTQKVDVKPVNGATWTFTWTYTITPIALADPGVGWYPVHPVGPTNADGSVPVTVSGQVAGESVLVKGGVPKYSFSILTTPGDQTTTRVSGLTWSVDGGVVANPGSSTDSGVDFAYTGNAGSNGTATGSLLNGDDMAILNGSINGGIGGDTFKGNDNGGADGSAAQLATVDALQVNLPTGDHNIVLAGSVKGNTIDTSSTGAGISFAVSTLLHIVTEQCGAIWITQ